MIYQIEDITNKSQLIIKTLTYKDTELIDVNLDLISHEEQVRLHQFGSVKRQLEFFYTRLLWKSFDQYTPIRYHETGRPYIQNGHLSITHSRNKIGIAFNLDKKVGIDLEHYSEKLFLISHKFLHESEIKTLNTTEIKSITKIWSIKEAVYKLKDIPGYVFKEDIIIKQLDHSPVVSLSPHEMADQHPFEIIELENCVLTICCV